MKKVLLIVFLSAVSSQANATSFSNHPMFRRPVTPSSEQPGIATGTVESDPYQQQMGNNQQQLSGLSAGFAQSGAGLPQGTVASDFSNHPMFRRPSTGATSQLRTTSGPQNGISVRPDSQQSQAGTFMRETYPGSGHYVFDLSPEERTQVSAGLRQKYPEYVAKKLQLRRLYKERDRAERYKDFARMHELQQKAYVIEREIRMLDAEDLLNTDPVMLRRIMAQQK